MAPETHYLFTYGTLMSGFDNPFSTKLRAVSSYEGRGAFLGKLYRVSWYPGAVYDESGKSVVHGEIYRLHTSDIWYELDEYEDVLEDEKASLYLRQMIPVITEKGAKLACWTYLYNQPVSGLDLIENGRFTG